MKLSAARQHVAYWSNVTEDQKFGLAVIPDGIGKAISLCLLAEKLGFSNLWVADEGPEFYDPFVILAAVALQTKRIELGVGLTNPYMRHPALLTSAMLSLDVISNGRAILGLGAGGSLALPKLGLPMWHKPVETLANTIDAVKSILAGKTTDAKRGVFQIRGVRWRSPRRIPIYIGTRGRRIMALAARKADGLILSTMPLALLEQTIQRIRSMRGRKSFEIAYVTRLSLAKSKKLATKLVKPYLAFAIADSPTETLELVHITEEKQNKIRRRLRARGAGSAASLIPNDAVEALAVVGTVRQSAAALEDIIAAGMDQLVVGAPYGPRPQAALTSFAQEAIARFRI